jgi:hypothetical protein
MYPADKKQRDIFKVEKQKRRLRIPAFFPLEPKFKLNAMSFAIREKYKIFLAHPINIISFP